MENLAYASAFGCLVLAAHLAVVRPPNRIPARLLGVSFLFHAVQAVLLGARFGGWLPALLAPLRPTLAMTLAPLLYLCLRSAMEPDFRLKPRHALHALPAMLVAVELLARRFPVDVDLAIAASFAVYALALGLRLRGGSAAFGHLGADRAPAFGLLAVSAFLLAGGFVSEVAILADLARGAPLAASPALLATLCAELVVVGIAILAALARPSPLDWIYAFGAPARRPRGPADPAQSAACAAFDRLVAAERIWLDETIRLAAVARRLDLLPRRLSEAINAVHGESFSRRMNRLRVEEAMRLLRGRPDLPVTAVMFDAGFRTKSSFNREFRALVGLSPSEYRDRGAADCRYGLQVLTR